MKACKPNLAVMMGVLAAALTICISVQAQKGKPGPPPPPPPANPAIAYTAERGWSTTDLMVMNADGTNQKVLLAGGTGPTSAGHHNPRWSPDGNWIAFCRAVFPSTTGIYKIRKDGSESCKVIDTHEACDYGAGMPQWSPDGSKLLYSDSAGPGLNEDLYLVDASCGADPSTKINMTNTNDVSEFFPAWSPDGTQIVTVLARPDGASDLLLYDVWPDWQTATLLVNLTDTEEFKALGFHDPKWGVTPRRFAAVTGDIMVIDVTDPFHPLFSNITNTLNAAEYTPGWGPSDQTIVYQLDGSIWKRTAADNWSTGTKIASGQRKIMLREPDWRPVP